MTNSDGVDPVEHDARIQAGAAAYRLPGGDWTIAVRADSVGDGWNALTLWGTPEGVVTSHGTSGVLWRGVYARRCRRGRVWRKPGPWNRVP